MDLYYNNDIFVDNLKMKMTEKNVSASELARFLGCSKSIVSDWLKGKKLPRIDKVDKMCVLFNCARSELISEQTENSKFDALEEDIINRFRMLNNQQKIAVYNSLNAIFGGFGV